MKATLICNAERRSDMMSDLYFRNCLFAHIHVKVDRDLSYHDLRVILYIPMDQMPREVIDWIDAQPNAVRVFIQA